MPAGVLGSINNYFGVWAGTMSSLFLALFLADRFPARRIRGGGGEFSVLAAAAIWAGVFGRKGPIICRLCPGPSPHLPSSRMYGIFSS